MRMSAASPERETPAPKMRIVRMKRKRDVAPLSDFELEVGPAQGSGATVEDLMAQVAGVDIRAHSEHRVLKRRVFKYVGTETETTRNDEDAEDAPRLTIKQEVISSVDSVRQRLIQGHHSQLAATRRLRLLRERKRPGQSTVLEVEAADISRLPPPNIKCTGGRMIVMENSQAPLHARDTGEEVDVYVEEEVEWVPSDPNSHWHYAAAKLESFCLPPGIHSEYDNIDDDDRQLQDDDDDEGDGREIDYPPTPSSSDEEAECTNTGFVSADEYAYYSKHQYYVLDDDEAEESRGGHSFVEDLSSRFADLGARRTNETTRQAMAIQGDSDDNGDDDDEDMPMKAKSAMF